MGQGRISESDSSLPHGMINFPGFIFVSLPSKIFDSIVAQNAQKSQVSVMSARADPAFSATGLSNWKRVLICLGT